MKAIGTILLGVVLVLSLPLLLPVMLVLGSIDDRRRKKIANQSTCTRCGKLLGEAALLESDRVAGEEWKQRRAKFPGVRFRIVRRHDAICSGCGQHYSYSDHEKAFLPVQPGTSGEISMPIIRRLNPGEGELFRTLRMEALQESPSAFTSTLESALSRTSESWAEQADASASGCDRATFVVLSPQPAGLCALYRDAEDASCGELLQMWIAPAHRGSGVAGDLLDHIFAWAAENGFHKVRAVVTNGNERALRFYLKCGFSRHILEGKDIVLQREVGTA